MNEHGTSPESKAKAQQGRDLRNEARIEDVKAPKTAKQAPPIRRVSGNDSRLRTGGGYYLLDWNVVEHVGAAFKTRTPVLRAVISRGITAYRCGLSAAPANATDLAIDFGIFLIEDLLRGRCRCGNVGQTRLAMADRRRPGLGGDAT